MLNVYLYFQKKKEDFIKSYKTINNKDKLSELVTIYINQMLKVENLRNVFGDEDYLSYHLHPLHDSFYDEKNWSSLELKNPIYIKESKFNDFLNADFNNFFKCVKKESNFEDFHLTEIKMFNGKKTIVAIIDVNLDDQIKDADNEGHKDYVDSSSIYFDPPKTNEKRIFILFKVISEHISLSTEKSFFLLDGENLKPIDGNFFTFPNDWDFILKIEKSANNGYNNFFSNTILITNELSKIDFLIKDDKMPEKAKLAIVKSFNNYKENNADKSNFESFLCNYKNCSKVKIKFSDLDVGDLNGEAFKILQKNNFSFYGELIKNDNYKDAIDKKWIKETVTNGIVTVTFYKQYVKKLIIMLDGCVYINANNNEKYIAMKSEKM